MQRFDFDITLASSSPRRKMLLEQAGVVFDIKTVEIDETFDEGLLGKAGIDAAIEDLAKRKAEAVRLSLNMGDCERRKVLLAADTVVCIDGRILGKPRGEEEAIAMLKSISGRVHNVKTGVCVMDASAGVFLTAVETTAVHIAPIAGREIREYVATGEPMDKAGAYAAQGLGARFVRRIEGCYYNVVGLPLGLTFDLLKKI